MTTTVVPENTASMRRDRLAFVKKTAKAFTAAVIAALASVNAVLAGDMTFTDLTTGQWSAAGLAAIVAFAGVYGVKNSTAE